MNSKDLYFYSLDNHQKDKGTHGEAGLHPGDNRVHMSHSLKSLKGGYMGDNIGEYSRVFKGRY